MEDFKKLQEALRVERHPSNIEVWRKETKSDSPYYSKDEEAYYDLEPPKTKNDLLERIIRFQNQWAKYKAQNPTPKFSIPALFTLFIPRGQEAVVAFLKRNDSLLPLLFEASKEIRKYFPESCLFLELISDPDGEDPDQLFAYISTDLPPREARPKLKALDRDWWLDAVGRAQGKLCISLEYQ
jgi:hypothetical protein